MYELVDSFFASSGPAIIREYVLNKTAIRSRIKKNPLHIWHIR